MELLNNKWVNINEVVAYKQIFTGNNKAPIMNLDRYIDEVNSWFNNMCTEYIYCAALDYHCDRSGLLCR